MLDNFTINLDSKFLRKLLSTSAQGVGAVAGAWLKRRDAIASADAKRIEAQGERDANDILSGKKVLSKNGELIEAESKEITVVREIIEADEVTARLIYQESKRQSNIRSIFDKASHFDSADVSDVDVDPDWIAKFFTYAQDVSNDEMQDMWAKILADEVKMPGSCSLRTLEILKVLTKNEAQLFEKIRPLLLGDFLPNDDKILSKYGVSLTDIIKLDEAGLINSGFGRAKIFRNSRINQEYLATAKIDAELALVVQHKNANSEFAIQSYALTKAGLEIDNCLPKINRDINFLEDALRQHMDQGYDFLLAPCDGNVVLINNIVKKF